MDKIDPANKVVKIETPDRGIFEHVPPGPGSWYCRNCHVLHVSTDTCPETGQRRADK